MTHALRLCTGRTLFMAGFVGATCLVSSAWAGGVELTDVQLDNITAGTGAVVVDARATANGNRPVAATLTSSTVVASGSRSRRGGVTGILGIGVAVSCCEQARSEVGITSEFSGSQGVAFDRMRVAQSATGMSLAIQVRAGVSFEP